MRVAGQGLHHREVDASFRQGGAERVPQRVGVPGGNAGDLAVVAEDPPQPGLGHRLAAVRALGHDEHAGAGRLGPLGQQVGLDHRADAGVQRHPAFPVAPAGHLHPPAADVRAGHLQAEDLAAAQPAVEHQPGDRPVPPGPGAGQQFRGLALVQRPRQPPRFPQLQRRPGRRTACASSPLRCPDEARRASRPFGTGFGASGSRMDRNANIPETAISRWLTVAAAYCSSRSRQSPVLMADRRIAAVTARQAPPRNPACR